MSASLTAALSSYFSSSHRWKDICSSPFTAQLEEIIADRGSQPWLTVQELRPELYQSVIDELQNILDGSPEMESNSRTTAIECLQAMCALSGRLPRSMTLRNVEKEGDNPYDGGGFGDVYFGQAGSRRVALKALRLFANGSNERDLKIFRREALLWHQLRHPRILPLLGVNTTMFSPRPCLISPFMKNGNVNQFLHNNPTHDRLQMIIEILEGIHFLHTHDPPLVHADIRGDNVLVQDDLTCCLADFGLSMVCNSRVSSSNIRSGATRWLAPEVIQYSMGEGQKFPPTNLPSRDIYAFGCTAIEICSGSKPFPNISHDQAVLYAVYTNKKKPPLPPNPTIYLSKDVWVVIDRCLVYQVKDRLDAAAALQCLKELKSRIDLDENWLLVDDVLSWRNIVPSMQDWEMRKIVVDMILQPERTIPWDYTETMNPALYQRVIDVLQELLDSLWQSSTARHTAIKLLQAINCVSGLLPTKLVLQNIKVVDRSRGYAEMFEGQNGPHWSVFLKSLKFDVTDAEKMVKSFRHDVLLWRQLRHERILPLFGIVTDPTLPKLSFVTPWMVNGNINAFLRENPFFPRIQMLIDIIEGIEYLHGHKPAIIHTDIRGVNILIKDDFSCCLSNMLVTVEELGPTMYWKAPEVWLHNDANIPARDIYAFGCTAIEIYSGTHPFPDESSIAIFHMMHQVVTLRCKPPRPSQLHNAALWEIVDACLAYTATRRPTAMVVFERLRTLASASRA